MQRLPSRMPSGQVSVTSACDASGIARVRKVALFGLGPATALGPPAAAPPAASVRESSPDEHALAPNNANEATTAVSATETRFELLQRMKIG
jgi:hypothetical protein